MNIYPFFLFASTIGYKQIRKNSHSSELNNELTIYIWIILLCNKYQFKKALQMSSEQIINNPEEELENFSQRPQAKLFYDKLSFDSSKDVKVYIPLEDGEIGENVKLTTRVQTQYKTTFQLNMRKKQSYRKNEAVNLQIQTAQDLNLKFEDKKKDAKDQERQWWSFIKPQIYLLRKLLHKSVRNCYIGSGDMKEILNYGSSTQIYHSENTRLLIMKNCVANSQKPPSKIYDLLNFILSQKVTSKSGICPELYSLPIRELQYQSQIYSIHIIRQLISKGFISDLNFLEKPKTNRKNNYLQFLLGYSDSAGLQLEQIDSFLVSSLITLIYEAEIKNVFGFAKERIKNFIEDVQTKIYLTPQSYIALNILKLKLGLQVKEEDVKLILQMLRSDSIENEWMIKLNFKKGKQKNNERKDKCFNKFLNLRLGKFKIMIEMVYDKNDSLNQEEIQYILGQFQPDYHFTNCSDYNFLIVRMLETLIFRGIQISEKNLLKMKQLLLKTQDIDIKKYLLNTLYLASGSKHIEQKKVKKVILDRKKKGIQFFKEYIDQNGFKWLKVDKFIDILDRIIKQGSDSLLSDQTYSLLLAIHQKSPEIMANIKNTEELQDSNFEKQPAKIIALNILILSKKRLKSRTITRIFQIYCKSNPNSQNSIQYQLYRNSQKCFESICSSPVQPIEPKVLEIIKDSIKIDQDITNNFGKNWKFSIKILVMLVENKKYNQMEMAQIAFFLLENLLQRGTKTKEEKSNFEIFSYALSKTINCLSGPIKITNKELLELIKRLEQEQLSSMTIYNLQAILMYAAKIYEFDRKNIEKCFNFLKINPSDESLQICKILIENSRTVINENIIQFLVQQSSKSEKYHRQNSIFLLLKINEVKKYLKPTIQQKITVPLKKKDEKYLAQKLYTLKQISNLQQLEQTTYGKLKSFLQNYETLEPGLLIPILQIFTNQLQLKEIRNSKYQIQEVVTEIQKSRSLPNYIKTKILIYWKAFSSKNKIKESTIEYLKQIISLFQSPEDCFLATSILANSIVKVELNNQQLNLICKLISLNHHSSAFITEVLILLSNQQKLNKEMKEEFTTLIEPYIQSNNEKMFSLYAQLLMTEKLEVKQSTINLLLQILFEVERESTTDLALKIIQIKYSKLNQQQKDIFSIEKLSRALQELKPNFPIEQLLKLISDGNKVTKSTFRASQKLLRSNQQQRGLMLLESISISKQKIPNNINILLVDCLQKTLHQKDRIKMGRILKILEKIYIQNSQNLEGLSQLLIKLKQNGYQFQQISTIETIQQNNNYYIKKKNSGTKNLDRTKQTKTKLKNLQQTLLELEQLNPKSEVSQIKNLILSKEKERKEIQKWSQPQIRQFSKKIRLQSSQPIFVIDISLIMTMLFVIGRAYRLDQKRKNSNGRLRFNQQIAFILFCLNLIKNKDKPSRILMQIATGEGKSTIIAMLAVFVCLIGFKADIITSQEGLAMRDKQVKSSFFKLFGLTTGFVSCKNQVGSKSTEKKCYKSDIVYGALYSFKFDYLQERYRDKNIRGFRNFNNCFAFVDEVDNMFIDNRSTLAILSTPNEGGRFLNPIFKMLWVALVSCFKQNREKLNTKDQSKLKDQVQKTKNVLRQTSDFIIKECYKSIEDSEKKIDNAEQINIIKIPKHLISYAIDQMQNWINSAVFAMFSYKDNAQYLLKKDVNGIQRIVPIDFDNNGQIQDSTLWSNGLHQFLQLKQGLKLVPESIITNYLSNKAYFSLYQQRLFGATGTIGSEVSLKYLRQSYQMKPYWIPKHNHSQLIQLTPIIVKNKKKWQEKILQSAKSIIDQGRCILMICQTKEAAQGLYRILSSKKVGQNILLYTRNDNHQKNSIKNLLKKGSIIISTNLAGRGTDIKISEQVQKNGGLHVTVTFLPKNLRVLLQNFGRAARKGERGSAQLIICQEFLPQSYANKDIGKMKKMKQLQQQAHLKRYLQNQEKVMKVKDDLFAKFCCFLSEIRNKKLKSTQEQVHNQFILKALEQRWGILLNKLKFNNQEERNQSIKQYQSFIVQVTKLTQSQKIIQNPYHFIQKAKRFEDLKVGILQSIYKKIRGNSYYQLIIGNYAKANQFNFTWIGHYNISRILILQHNNINHSQILEELKKAHKILGKQTEQETAYLNLAYSLFIGKDECDLINQIQGNVNILNASLRSIESNMRIIEKSIKFVNVQTCEQQKTFSTYGRAIQFINNLERIEKNQKVNITLRDLSPEADLNSYSELAKVIDFLQRQKCKTYKIGLKRYSTLIAIKFIPYFLSEQEKQQKNNKSSSIIVEFTTQTFKTIKNNMLVKAIDKFNVVETAQNFGSGAYQFISQKKSSLFSFINKKWTQYQKCCQIPISIAVYENGEFKQRFNKISQKEAVQKIRSFSGKQFQVQVSFESLTAEQANLLSYLNCDLFDNYGTALIVTDIQRDLAVKCLKKNPFEKYSLEIKSDEPLKQSFTIQSIPKNEIAQYQSLGITHLYNVSTRKLFKKCLFILITALGVAQIIAGCHFNSWFFGKAMIALGIGDILFCLNSLFSNQLSLGMFLIQKSINIIFAFGSKVSKLISRYFSATQTVAVQVSQSFAMICLQQVQNQVFHNVITQGMMLVPKHFQDDLRSIIQRKVREKLSKDAHVSQLLAVDTHNNNEEKFKQIKSLLQYQLSGFNESSMNKIMRSVTTSVLSMSVLSQCQWVNVVQVVFGIDSALSKYKYIDEIMQCIIDKLKNIKRSEDQQNIVQNQKKIKNKIQQLIVVCSQEMKRSIIDIIQAQIIQPISCNLSCKLSRFITQKIKNSLRKTKSVGNSANCSSGSSATTGGVTGGQSYFKLGNKIIKILLGLIKLYWWILWFILPVVFWTLKLIDSALKIQIL